MLIIALKYCGLMLVLLAIVFVIAVFTPKAAVVIDKLISSVFRRDKSMNFNENDDIYKVRSIYDAQYHSSDEKKNIDGEDKNG